MIQVAPQMRVLVAVEPADFRKGIDGLARLARDELDQDPFSGSLFVLHMWEHMVFGLIAPPLLLWGTPWWLIRFAVRPIMPVVRIVTKPIVAFSARTRRMAAGARRVGLGLGHRRRRGRWPGRSLATRSRC